MKPTSPQSKGIKITLSPIPVRLCPLVTALVREYIFEVLDVISVPWEEHSRGVNLFNGIESENEGRENVERTLTLRSICK